uniref:Protein containing flavodoxin-like fold domain n=1 Tax=uncultured Flavobacteriia bacterium TaxID=212695 RepID=H6RGP9_9BACT|nr:protein containing flavodoxin-like fold domain [uncultured Flavobacteriia bacterium]
MQKKIQPKMKNLIIIGHPNVESFCYDGIFKTINNELSKNKEEIEVIDLYRDDFIRPRKALTEKYQKLVTWSERIYFISPIWWFRLTPRMEIFFDEVFVPGFAYEFVNITKLYAYPRPFLKDKIVRTYVTHGAPSLPVRTLYLNSVKLRLVMGVYTFVFGWRVSLFTKTKQFWSVPFVSEAKRKKYLKSVERDINKDLVTNLNIKSLPNLQ